MTGGPTILAFDTSAQHCAVAVLRGDTALASRAEEMARGQAERLFPLIEAALANAGIGWGDIDRIGVGTGPGNFTGIRIAVASARGLALSLGVPAIGVTTFDAIRLDAPDADVAVPAPRGMVYLSRPGAEPVLLPEAEAQGALRPPAPDVLALAVARVAAGADAAASGAPAPLYLRPADAAPPADAPPEIVDDA